MNTELGRYLRFTLIPQICNEFNVILILSHMYATIYIKFANTVSFISGVGNSISYEKKKKIPFSTATADFIMGNLK